MKKSELKAWAEKYRMEIVRNEITSEFMFLRLETAEDIPELDALDKNPEMPVVVTKAYGGFEDGAHLYTVYCPTNWFDLWGWR